MALSKIRLANKKARRESRRKGVRSTGARQRTADKVRKGRMRKMMAQGQQEHKAARRGELDYINRLEAELGNGE